jgi:Fe-S oxidoreductase
MPCVAARGVDSGVPEDSIEISRNRLSQIIEETGSEILLTECPSCLHNFRNAKLRKQKIKIYNITEFIAQLYQERQQKDAA